jgi:hypothetical protein
MDKLDHSVEEEILGMARGILRVTELAPEAKRRVSRWILKTACCLCLTMKRDRRHLPPRFWSAVKSDDFLPEGFFAFASHSTEPIRLVGTCLLRFWHFSTTPPPNLGYGFKFGVIYDNVLLGCALSEENPVIFTGYKELHHPLHLQGCDFDGEDPEEYQVPPMLAPTPLHWVLSSVNARKAGANRQAPQL